MNPREKMVRWLEEKRFDPSHHLGLGDIRLTMDDQEELLTLIQPGEPVAWARAETDGIEVEWEATAGRRIYQAAGHTNGHLPLYLAPPSRDKPGFFYLTESGQVLPWQEVARLLREAGHDVMVQPGFSYQPSREREAMTEEKAEELVNLFWAAIEDAVGAIGTPTTEKVRKTRQDLVDAILAAQDGTDPRHGLEENGNNYIRWARTKAEIRKAFLDIVEVGP